LSVQSSGVPATVEPTSAVPAPPAAYTSWERTAAADDLRRRQEELERKAAELEQREQEMQRNLQLQGILIHSALQSVVCCLYMYRVRQKKVDP